MLEEKQLSFVKSEISLGLSIQESSVVNVQTNRDKKVPH